MSKRIFTFWEPKENIPAYLNLCLKTWKKFIPDYEIVILDYSNLEKYLGKDYFDNILYSDFSLPKQADAIRAAVLKKYGGIWLDLDTIITSENVKDFLDIDSNFVTIGSHIAFVKANKNSKIVSIWDKKIKKHLQIYKIFKYGHTINKKIVTLFYPSVCKKLENWDYLGNYILRKLFKTKNKKEYLSIDKWQINAFPELINQATNQLSIEEVYKNYYFRNDFSSEVLSVTKGIILLHNSWTPDEFKRMSDLEFLNSNCTLSNLLKNIL